MDTARLLFSSATLILSIAFAVGCVRLCWTWGSPATRRPKPQPSEQPTPTSGQLAKIEADQVELFSALAKLSDQMMRWQKRQAVQEHRDRKSGPTAEPPVGASKAELRQYYIPGLNHIEVARRANGEGRSS